MPETTNSAAPAPDPDNAEEKALLLTFLSRLRESVAAKAEGVPDPEVRAAGVPSGTSLLGLVHHLACVERFYFLGKNPRSWPASWRPDPRQSPDAVLADYRAAVRQSDEVIAACTDLSALAPRAAGRRSAPSMRWVLVHMIEETGRHAGHADILREQIDGATGD